MTFARAALPHARLLVTASMAALLACAKGVSQEAWIDTTPAGFVAVPTVEPIDASDPPDARAAASRVAVRALPPEPAEPPHAANCSKETICREQDDAPPALAFAPPFERCTESYGGPASARFSVVETRAARRNEPAACCYVEYRDCVIDMPPPRPHH